MERRAGAAGGAPGLEEAGGRGLGLVPRRHPPGRSGGRLRQDTLPRRHPPPGDTPQDGVGDGSDRTDLGSGSGLPGLACLSASQKAWDGQRCLPVGSASETTVHQHLESNKATDKLCRPRVPCVLSWGPPSPSCPGWEGHCGPHLRPSQLSGPWEPGPRGLVPCP